MKLIITILVAFAAGLGAGYFRWGNADREAVSELAVSAPDQFSSAEPVGQELSELEALIVVSENLVGQGDYAGAMSVLREADLVAETAAEQSLVVNLFRDAVNRRVDELAELGRVDDIDALYEQLTLSMPEQAEYYILLAEHRIAMNNGDLALPVLAQIENHHQLGGRARELIRQINAPLEPLPLASIPLIKAGDQFLVEALVDQDSRAFLLLDTGASMTIVSPDLLIDLGYGLSGPRINFNTAGGMVRAPIVDIESLSLEGITVQPMTVGALEIGRRDDRVSGLLGMDFLRRFEFRIDQDGEFLILIDQRS